jgi:hypothetical protein
MDNLHASRSKHNLGAPANFKTSERAPLSAREGARLRLGVWLRYGRASTPRNTVLALRRKLK